jgi:hypothetical protein
VPVEVLPSTVINGRASWVGVSGFEADLSKRDTAFERGHDEPAAISPGVTSRRELALTISLRVGWIPGRMELE